MHSVFEFRERLHLKMPDIRSASGEPSRHPIGDVRNANRQLLPGRERSE
jgi:hypothetical protein